MKLGKRHMRRGHLAKVIERKGALVARMLASPPARPLFSPGTGLVAALGNSQGSALSHDLSARVPWLDRPREPAELDTVHDVATLVAADDQDFGGGLDAVSRIRGSFESRATPDGAPRPFIVALDYFIHDVQLRRVADAGADAVVLMACVLGDAELKALVGRARDRGIEPIIECTDADDLAVARALEIRIVAVSVVDRDTLKPVTLSPEFAKGLAVFERSVALSADTVPANGRFDATFLEHC